MKAAVSARYGPPNVVVIRQVTKPVPGPNEVLVRVHATTVSRTDCGMRRGHPPFIRFTSGLLRPKHTILGMDFAGTVEAVGVDVTAYKTGDRLFGVSPDTFGAHGEYLCVPAKGMIAALPAKLLFDEAVVCEGAWYAFTCLKRLGVEPGTRLLIYGASGAIGTAAVQIAKSLGANVTAVVGTRHADLAVSLGADRVIDYSSEDFTQISDPFDGILDAVGKTTFFRCRHLLKPDAVFATTDLGPGCQSIFLELWSSITGSGRVTIPMPKQSPELVSFIADEMVKGRFRAVIDRTYPLEKIVDAYRYVETERKTGIVVIQVYPEDAG